MIEPHMPIDVLERYVAGGAPKEERVAVERHAAVCETCRLTLAATGLARTAGTPEEEALVARSIAAYPTGALLADLGIEGGSAAARRARERWFGRYRRVAVAAAAAIAACLALVLALPPGGDGTIDHRVLEGRPARLATHLPVRALRGAPPEGQPSVDETDPGRAVALLLARGAAGDWERAETLIGLRPETADRENDLGVLLLARGDQIGALAAFERALALDEANDAARFNRAVALESLGRRAEAREAWRHYLAGAEDDDEGWREEARRRLGQ